MSTKLDGTCVIMDDLLVGGSGDEEHLRNLEAVFVQLEKFGLQVKLPKCVFKARSVAYFELHFSKVWSSTYRRKKPRPSRRHLSLVT